MSPTSDSLSQSPPVVAVVDDDAAVMTALQRWLGTHGALSLGCPDADALFQVLVGDSRHWTVRAQAGGSPGHLSAAIIDLNLPGINGFELARRLLAVDPSLRVVVITAALWEGEPGFDQPPPGVVCLSKPFRLDDIESLVFGVNPT